MNKKLAIKGHSTRGKEVIKLLEMMGGDPEAASGFRESYCYYISEYASTKHKHICWDYIGPEEIDKYEIFTLEEFLKKYPFKVGDKVMDVDGNLLTIKSMSWSDDCESMVYDFEETEDVLATEDLLRSNAEFLVNKEKGEENGKMLCDITLRHLHRISLKNVLSELYEHIKTTPKEDLEKEFKEIEEWSHVGPTVEEFMDFCDKVNKKPKYPKTFAECCEKLGIEVDLWFVYEDIDGNHINSACISNYRIRGLELYHNLEKLKICRDAYWKIAGEEMGLGKPWEPDWNEETDKFTISNKCNKIYLNNTAWYAEVLSFPTAEMRDAFYKNFKDLIEQCKELL